MVEEISQWGLPVAAIAVALLSSLLSILVWRARGRAPRSFGLGLVLFTCLCAGLSMVNPRLPVVRRTVSIDELEQELSSPMWRLWPRGAITIEVTPKDLEKERDVGEIIDIALARGVRIDVELPEGNEPEPNEARMRLVWKREGQPAVDLSPTVSFVESGSPSVWPEIAGTTDHECRMDGGTWRGAPSLEDLFQSRGVDRGAGFHRLACRAGANRAIRYVHVSDRGVVFARSPEAERSSPIDRGWLAQYVEALDDPNVHGLLHPTVVDIAEPPGSAGMLVLEYPQDRPACDAALTVLRRGGTVVLADPSKSFQKLCPELRIVDDGPGVWHRIDRRPQLSIVIDRTLDDLDWKPSCTFDDEDCIVRGGPAPREPAWKSQVDFARQLCNRALEKATDPRTDGCGVIDDAARNCRTERWRSSAEQLVAAACQPGPLSRLPDSERRDSTSLDELLEKVSERGGSAPNREPLRDNHVVVAFPSIAPELVGGEDRLCVHYRRDGGRVLAVQPEDPYGAFLTELAVQTGWKERNCPLPNRLTPFTLPLDKDRGPKPPDPPGSILDLFDAQSEAQATATWTDRGRFRESPSDDWVYAPIHLRTWSPDDALLTPASGFPPIVTTRTQEHDKLDARALAAGTVVDRGHLVVLGYSPFEFIGGVTLINAESSPKWKNAQPASAGELGPGLLQALYSHTAFFLRSSPDSIYDVQETNDGRVSIRVIRSIAEDAEELATLELRSADMTLEAPLVDLDVGRQIFTYVLSRSDVEALVGRGRCTTVTPRLGDELVAGGGFVLCLPEKEARSAIVLAGTPALRALASFTGGCYADEPCDSDVGGGPHDLWVAGVALGFLGLWGARAVRLLRARSTRRLLQEAEHQAEARYDQPEALAAAEGEWGLHTSSWPRTGAAGGLRPLEPGDRSSAILTRDLLMMSRGELAVLPTVRLRIVEATPVTRVVLNLGATMRADMLGDRAPKVRTALHVAELVLSTVWQRRGPASLAGVGLAEEIVMIEPVALHPGPAQLTTATERALASAPAARWPWSSPLDAGALVYVSDFMQEPPAQLEQWLRDAETAGVHVAGVLVYSPAELTMVEGGTLPSSGAWADRSDWTVVDLERAFRSRFDRIEALFDITTGGLTIVDTTMSTEEIESCIAARRLSEVLR